MQVWLSILLSWAVISLVSTVGEFCLSDKSAQTEPCFGMRDYGDHFWNYLQFMLPQGKHLKAV